MAEAAVAHAEARLAILRRNADRSSRSGSKTAPPRAELPTPGLIGRFSFEKIDDRKFANDANEKEPGVVFDDVTLAPGQAGNAVVLSGENNVNFALGGNFTRDDPFSFALWMKTPDVKDRCSHLSPVEGLD